MQRVPLHHDAGIAVAVVESTHIGVAKQHRGVAVRDCCLGCCAFPFSRLRLLLLLDRVHFV